MDDHHHWRYACIACVLVLAGGFLLDAWPLYQSCQRKQLEESVLIKQLHSQQRVIVSATNLHQTNAGRETGASSRVSLLQAMTNIAHASGARLTSMNSMSVDDEKDVFRERAKCELQGTYRELLGVITLLEKVSNGLLMRDFSMKMTELGDFFLLVDVSMLNTGSVRYSSAVADMDNPVVTALYNPFCAGGDGQVNAKVTDQLRLRSAPAGLLQMAAYMRLGKQAVAWIRLPEGDVVQIERGDVIGREQASVEVITQDQVMLALPTGVTMQIRFGGGVHA